MITVHHEKETDFSKNGYGAIDDYVINPEVGWELNGEFYVSFEYPSFLDKASHLKNKNILRVPVPFMQDQLFRIYRTRKVLGFIEVEARHIFYDLLDNLIEDTNIVGKDGQGALQQLLGATQYPHRFIGLSDITLTNNARMVRYNPVEALLDDAKSNSFVSRWGGEVVRDNFTIRMTKHMGVNRGVHIQHKKDLTGYEATIDESTVVTRIMPTGFDGLRLPELYVDSPLLDPDNPKIRVIKYDDVKAAIGEYADDEDAIPLNEAYSLLRQYAKEEYSVNHLDEPETVISVSFVTLHNTKEYEELSSLQEVHQGDVVKVSVPDEGFEITSRLVAFTSDPLQKDHYRSTTLGNHVFEFTTSNNESAKIRNELDQIRESITTVLQAANGKNRNFWGTADPNTLNLKADVGDIYYRENGEETTLYRYVEVNGERYWKEIVDTADIEKVKREVEDALAKAEAAQEAVENAYTDAVTEAERLVAEQSEAFDAKLEAETSTIRDEITTGINDAITNANNYTDGQKQAIDNQINLVEQEMSHVKSTADSAVNSINTAIANAGFTSLSDSLTGIKSIANQAKMDAQTGITNAATALSQAQSAISQLGGLSGKITSVEKDIDEINGVLSTKVSATEFNSLTGTVTNLSTTQTQQAGLIAQKANQSTVDTLTGRVSTAEGQITTQAGQIALRVTEVQAKNIADSAVDGLEIGGRNLIVESALIDGYYLNITGASQRNSAWVFTDYIRVEPNTDYISSNYYNLGYSPATCFYDADKVYISGLSGSSRYKFTTPSNARFVRVSIDKVGLGQIKLEKGNKATDWTPAPEDTLELISSVSAELSIEKDNITALLTRTGNNETAINQVKNTADGTKQTVANHAGKITTLETNVNGLQISVADKVSNAQFTVLSNSVSSVVSDLNNLEIGGRNLLTNAPKESLSIIASENKLILYRISEPLELNKEYTLSFVVELTSGDFFYTSVTRENNTTILNLSGNQSRNGRYEYTFKATSGVSSEGIFVMFNNRLSNHATNKGSMIVSYPQLEKGNKSTDWTPAPEDTQSQITQLSDQINLRVTKGELLSQINVQADNILIQTNKLYLDVNSVHMTTAYVDELKAKSIEAVTANITSIRSQILVSDVITSTYLKVDSAMITKLNVNNLLVNYLVTNSIITSSMRTNSLSAITANITDIRAQILQANVVESTHLKADTALINKLFATNALIETLTSKQAFINSIKAIDISADRITAGTLNAANVNIINLNVSKIVGLNSAFVQSAWNGISTRISIDSTAITASDSEGNQAIINTSGEIRSTAGGTDKTRGIFHKGRLWFHTTSGSAVLNIGAHPVVGEGVNRGSIATARAEKLVIGRYNDYLTTNINAKVNPYITLEYGATLGDESNAFTKVWHDLSMSGKFINDVQQVSGFELAVRATSGRLMLGVTGYNTLQVGNANTRSYGNIEMQPGYSVTNASDERWKNIVGNTDISALSEIRRLTFVDYYWKQGIQEKQFGLIAQHTPFLAVVNEDGFYSLDNTKQVMMNTLGIKELDSNVINLADRVNLMDHRFADEINAVRITSNNALTKTQELEQRVEELENEIELLKSA